MDGVGITDIRQMVVANDLLSLVQLVERIERFNLRCLPGIDPVDNAEKVARVNEFLRRMVASSGRAERLECRFIFSAFELHASPRVDDFTTGVQDLASKLVASCESIFTEIKTFHAPSFGDIPVCMIDEFHADYAAFKQAMQRWTTHLSNEGIQALIKVISEAKDKERDLPVIFRIFDSPFMAPD